jgi:hypothetical protein
MEAQKMTKENTSIQPRRVLGTIFRVLAIGGALVLTILVAAHFAWKYSGSNQWEPVIDKDGIKIYTLKAPGEVVERVRGVTHVKTTLNAAVAMMMQTDTKACREWFPGCTSVQAIQPWNPEDLTYIHLYRLTAFRPFSPREWLLKARASQDPQTKSVLIEFLAVPDELPQNSCCFRVSHLHNTWRFTPLDNGLVEVENRQNVDLGIPYVMFNRFIPSAMYRVLARLPKYLEDDRLQQAKYDLIKEKS